VLLVTGILKHFVLLSDEFLHLFKRGAHFSSASDQGDQDLGISGVALSIANGELYEALVNDFVISNANQSTYMIH
jgi:hypothetical protein